MQRKDGRPRLGRRPLGELSNAHSNHVKTGARKNGVGENPVTAQKKFPASLKKMDAKPSAGRGDAIEDEAFLDRMLLVQSDLSGISRQIDEIVAQLFKHKGLSKQGKEEFESFVGFLSGMMSSLKAWGPKLQNALCDSPKEPEKLVEPFPGSLASWTGGRDGDPTDDNSDEEIALFSPEQTTEPLISPSPLVSWRANCTVERGRQLFLLTPLPISKGLSSKCQDSTRSVLEKIASVTGSRPLLAFSEETNDVLKDETEQPNPSRFSKEPGLVSPVTLPRKDHSVLLMTPCLKISPPKSCALLEPEPIAESVHFRNCNSRKSTPFPVRLSSYLEELSDSAGSEDYLAKKYPELLGIHRAQKLDIRRKEREASPNWFASPPKSCIVMEPPKVTPVNIAATHQSFNNHEATFLLKPNALLDNCQKTEPFGKSPAMIESTPWRDPQSTFGKGKRPGETTLKKELWTKFEAVSSFGAPLKDSVVPDPGKKGFLDMLEEASLDENDLSAS